MSSKKEVLYVDDEFINLELFKLNFGDDFEVHTADSGDDGLSIIQNNPGVVLVISDLRMPNMDGLEFILKAREYNTAAEYYLFSGFEKTAGIREAMDKGLIQGYFRKPLDLEDLLDRFQYLAE